jgi:hypothetical protein
VLQLTDAVCTVVAAGLARPCELAHTTAADLSCDGPDHEVPAADLLPCGQQPRGCFPQKRLCVYFTQGQHSHVVLQLHVQGVTHPCAPAV